MGPNGATCKLQRVSLLFWRSNALDRVSTISGKLAFVITAELRLSTSCGLASGDNLDFCRIG
jgi:hypothetical protein